MPIFTTRKLKGPIILIHVHYMLPLQVLYLQQNKLKGLPTTIGNLTNLATLNLSENNLKVSSVLHTSSSLKFSRRFLCQYLV